MNLELLESRFAPATLVNPTTLRYADIDGDLVTVTTSAGTFTLSNPNGDFTDSFVFTPPNAVGGQQLFFVHLSGSGFQGADLTFTVVQAGNGDGLAAVGKIDARGVDLGAVRVNGDLGEIDVGDANTATPALGLLSVRSMGRYGQAIAPFPPEFTSEIKGALGALRVREDIFKASIEVTADIDADAKVGAISIGGALIGGSADFSGRISAEGNIGPAKIGGDLIGGDGVNSGQIEAGGDMASATIGGSIVGASGDEAGVIDISGDLGKVRIRGNVIGGSGPESGGVSVGGKIAAVTIGGSLLGGSEIGRAT
jgi:hypothetical protein